MDILSKPAARATRHTAKLSALVLMMLPLACAPALANSAGEAIRVIDRWAAAYNAQDGSAVLKLYAADAVLFGTARPLVFDGAKPIGTAFARLAESANTVRICRRQTLVLGQDSVLVTGSYEFETLAHGIRESMHDRFTMMIVKRQGDWRISYHTTSHAQPATDSAADHTAAAGQTSDFPIALAEAVSPDSSDACWR